MSGQRKKKSREARRPLDAVPWNCRAIFLLFVSIPLFCSLSFPFLWIRLGNSETVLAPLFSFRCIGNVRKDLLFVFRLPSARASTPVHQSAIFLSFFFFRLFRRRSTRASRANVNNLDSGCRRGAHENEVLRFSPYRGTRRGKMGKVFNDRPMSECFVSFNFLRSRILMVVCVRERSACLCARMCERSVMFTFLYRLSVFFFFCTFLCGFSFMFFFYFVNLTVSYSKKLVIVQ